MSTKPIPNGLVKTWAISKEPVVPPKVVKAPNGNSKRVKACFQCRKSKIKCDNNNGDYSNPCKRCLKHNLECYYEYKTSQYKNVNEKEKEGQVLVVPKENKASQVPSDNNLKRGPGDTLDIGVKKLKRFTLTPVLSEIILLDECLELFNFFNKNIASQLFGFTLLKNINVRELFESNSLLLSTVSYIASIHHLSLNIYSEKLKQFFNELILKFIVIRDDQSRNDSEVFYNILSLCLAGFWLNQNFTSIAIQHAKNSGMNLNCQSSILSEDRIKLWYLLYTLDGQQALAYNRESLMTGARGNSVKKMKGNLLKKRPSSLFHDIRLVSQVEYNTIINDMFLGKSWDVLDPSRFGIPFKSNMELDKWMVHWTVLFGSMKGFDNNVWSSKSTLIYYNFAKMHINSQFIRGLIGTNEVFLKWKEIDQLENEGRLKDLTDDDDDNDNENNEHNEDEYDEFDQDDDDDDDETGVVSERDPHISSQIATASAFNILQLFLFDDDVVNSLKFCPTHIHVLLYYAVIIALNSPSMSANGYNDFFKLIKLLKHLLKTLSINLPIDKEFGLKMVFQLKKLMVEKFESILQEDILDMEQNLKLREELKILKNNSHIEEDYESDEDEFNNNSKQKRITAWPGTDHSHPVVSKSKVIDFSP